MIDALVQVFAMLGVMVLGVSLLIVAQVVRRQLHPERIQPCCPPLPPGQHFTGCTSWPAAGSPAVVPQHSHVYFGGKPSVRQPCEWCDAPAGVRAVRDA